MKSALSSLSLLVCLCAAPLAFAGPPGAETSEASEAGSILGVVTDEETGEPVENALVILQCACLSEAREAMTNTRGIYRFDALPVGAYTIQVLHGTANVSKIVELPRGAKFRANFKLNPREDKALMIVVEGAATSRDFTSVVDLSPTASRDAAGISLAGTTSGSQAQAGTLTCGTLDDSHDDSELRRFARETFPEFSIAHEAGMGPRTEVVVVDAAGRPVSDARLDVRDQDNSSAAILELRTGTDGRAIVSGWDFAIDPDRRAPKVRIVATKDGHSESTVVRLGSGQAKLRLGLRRTKSKAKIHGLDLLLVLDSTGSMHDEIAWLEAELRDVVETTLDAHPGVDVRLGLVRYRDQSDEFVVQRMPFTSDRQTFQYHLSQTRADGGGDYPEAVDEALTEAANFSWRHDQQVAKVALLVADAPPHDDKLVGTFAAATRLREAGVSLYPVASSGTLDLAELVFRSLAADTGSQYLFLTDDSGIGLPHAEPHTEDYEVELLRDALLRILAAELDGAQATLPKRSIEAGFALQHSLLDSGGLEVIEGGPRVHFGL